MRESRLILIDGMPGSGKSTTASNVSDKMTASGIESRLFFEISPDNPLFINTPALDPLHSEEASDAFAAKVLSMYERFLVY